MRGDQKIIRTDRLSRGLQFNADVCVFSIDGNAKREEVQCIEDGLDRSPSRLMRTLSPGSSNSAGMRTA